MALSDLQKDVYHVPFLNFIALHGLQSTLIFIISSESPKPGARELQFTN